MKVDRPLLPQGPQLLAPAKLRWVVLSLCFALLFSLLPWPLGANWLVPDFLLITLAYWHLRAPRYAGVGLAFACGLFTDMAHGVLIGQHALGYSMSAYFVISLLRRVENFPLPGQAAHLAPILFGQLALVLLVGMALGEPQTDWRYLAGGLLSALLWLPWALVHDWLTGRLHPIKVHSDKP